MSKPWSLKSSLILLRKLDPEIRKAGYSIGLTGSVLLKGKSFKDLDIIVYPLNTEDYPPKIGYLQNILIDNGLEFKLHTFEVKEIWKKRFNSNDKKLVEVWSYKGRRIDIFYLK